MKIEPKYVTFEQAQLFKEKEFNTNIKKNLYLTESAVYLENETLLINQNNKSGSICMFENIYAAPEQWQIVEWLRLEHGIWIKLTTYAFGYQYHLDNTPDPKTWNIDRRYDCSDDFKSPQEAYSAAFDHILKELI